MVVYVYNCYNGDLYRYESIATAAREAANIARSMRSKTIVLQMLKTFEIESRTGIIERDENEREVDAASN